MMNNWILNVEDLTEKVSDIAAKIQEGKFNSNELPVENYIESMI